MPRLLRLAAGAALIALAGCGGAVRVDPPAPQGSAAAACEELETALPKTLDGLPRVESDPPSPYVAVWGEGAIALRCGVDRPAAMAATDRVDDINGVGWFADPVHPTLFTSVNREAYVEVTISAKHSPGQVLLELADPIKTKVP